MFLWHAISSSWESPSSASYLIFSGIAAALPGYAAFFVWMWRIRCEEEGCWRVSKRTDHRGNKVCRKHYALGVPKPAWDAIEKIRELNSGDRSP